MGTRERREREKQERRATILRAARDLFRTNGYDATTMPAVARAAEIAPGTVYLYFPSKESLYVELLVEGYDVLIERLNRAVARQKSARDKAGALADAFFAFAADHPEYFNIIFFVLQHEGRSVQEVFITPDLAARLARRQDACKKIAADVLHQADPKIPEKLLELRVDALWSMLSGVVLYFLNDGPAVFRKVSGEAKTLVLRSIFGD